MAHPRLVADVVNSATADFQAPRHIDLDVADLCAQHPRLREPVVEGLLRRGETMNVVGGSKSQKSWLVADLAIAVALGRPWLGYPTSPGRVLLIDNELHPDTIAHRIKAVADARGVSIENLRGRLTVRSLRGRLVDVFALEPTLAYEPGTFRLVVVDAWYRMLPAGENSENSNGTVTQAYNALDRMALHLDAAFSVVHHASKGSQSAKQVTDVGAGAGAQSRAADTHLVLRPHKEDGCFVLDAELRSWPRVKSAVLRWTYPTWSLAPDLDPTDLREAGSRRKKEPAGRAWNLEAFVAKFVSERPVRDSTIAARASREGISGREYRALRDQAVDRRLVFRHGGTGRRPLLLATNGKGDHD
jgi:hypothetical protein